MNPVQAIDVRSHLSEEQMTECLMGAQSSAKVSVHLSHCSICKEELERLGAAVGSFNAVTLAWGESRAWMNLVEGSRGIPARSDRRWLAMASWALAACLMLVCGLAFYSHRERSDASANLASAVAVQEDSEAQIAQDNKLLTEVDLAIRDYGRSPVEEYGLVSDASDPSRPQGESRNP